MDTTTIHKTRRSLPHWTRDGATYWITFRLADSIPESKMAQWRRKRDQWMKLHPKPWPPHIRREYEFIFGDRYENWLDAGYGSCVLRSPDCRNIVKDCLFRFQHVRVHVHHAVLMPNHVHAILEPISPYRLSDIMKGIKGASSRACNRLLGRTGRFWMAESYDHIVRNEKEFDHFIRYIDENPGKAGLRDDEYWLMER